MDRLEQLVREMGEALQCIALVCLIVVPLMLVVTFVAISFQQGDDE